MNEERYKLIRSLGKGGMGEVSLVHDIACDRQVALKQIRTDLQKFPTIRSRFLREAHIAAQLTHPSIIPIFSISKEEGDIYYTMPYVEGETLKQILKDAKSSDLKGGIPALMRIFISVCQAVAYCHSKSILHRDLKPENILVGKFGEVMIVDWGLAQYKGQKEEVSEEIPSSDELTRPGKIVGTLAYLAPERAKNEPADEQTDLYALGVILYQILTLRLPFKRVDIDSFQKMWPYEELVDPIELAPYRDIPHALNQIVKKALHPAKETRYPNMTDFIADLESFIEGRPEWIKAQELTIEHKDDWEFQENILLAKHIAITRSTDVMEWVNLMISKASFSGNTKVEGRVRLGDTSMGIGFLLNIPEASERKDLMDGYCLWIGSHKNPGCKLFRCNIEVLEVENIALEPNSWNHIRIEKTDSHLRLYINDVLRCHYISHSPLAGTHVGLLFRDADLEVTDLNVSLGSQNVTVSCLAIPDAFLANKDYEKALSEYRRIAVSFPGRAEGREALFRAGITLLEEGLIQTKPRLKSRYLSGALEEFGKLRGTAGAPLEYLGKSLVYKALEESEEEAKCIELAIRKFRDHPLFDRLIEHVVFRLHESSLHDRSTAYQFALLSLRHLPQIFSNPDNQQLIDSIKDHWDTIPFIHPDAAMVQLAFFLNKPITLLEIVESGPWVEDAYYALLALGYHDMVKKSPRLIEFPMMQAALAAREKGAVSELAKEPATPQLKAFLIQSGFDQGEGPLLFPFLDDDVHKLWVLLMLSRWEEAGALFEKYPLEQLSSDTSPLFPLFGCFLWATEGEAIAKTHFNAIVETPYPHTTALLGHFLLGKIDLKQLFAWEQMELYRQLILFYHCSGKSDEKAVYSKQLKKLQSHGKKFNISP